MIAALLVGHFTLSAAILSRVLGVTARLFRAIVFTKMIKHGDIIYVWI
jgi:hypothetical protein